MRLLRIVIAALGLALAGTAQNRSLGDDLAGSSWRVGTCESLVWQRALADRKKIDAEFGISRTSPPAMDYENENTVPLLLSDLRRFGESEPPPLERLIIDTQFHLVSALRSVTNTDQGMYYPRWAAWWEANRQFPRQKWILDGFAARGLHAVDPVDERFGLELIGALGSSSPYGSNALKLIASATPSDRAKWVAIAASSDDRNLRLGVLWVLSSMDQPGRDDLLRKLAGDSDLQVRRNARTILNRILRASLSTRPAANTDFCRVEFVGKQTSEIASVVFAGDLLVVVYPGKVRAFDPRTRREVWTQPIPPAVGEFVLAAGGEVLLASRGGALLAFDLGGNTLWQRNADNRNWTDDNANEVGRLVQHGTDVLVSRWHTLERLDLRTGAKKATYRGADMILGAAATGTAACFVDERELRCLDGRKHEFAGGRDISITARAICLSEEKSYGHGHLACYDPGTLSEMWSAPLQANVETPLQDGSRVFVHTGEDITAFATSDGSVLWSTVERQQFEKTIPTDYGLLLENDEYRLELRDPQTGEVRRVWPEMPLIGRFAVHNNFAAIAGRDVLWLVDLRDGDDRR